VKLHPAFDPLRALCRWCAWHAVWNAKHERWAKVPMAAPDRRARVDVPGMWLTLERADDLRCVLEDQGSRAGLGLLLGAQRDGLYLRALDLDAAMTAGGRLKPWARAALDVLDGHYIEWSPGGRGVHVLVLASEAAIRAFDAALKAVLPKHITRRRKFPRETVLEEQKAEAIEVLTSGFVTVTGTPLPSSGTAIRHVTDGEMCELAGVIAAFIGVNQQPPEETPALSASASDCDTPPTTSATTAPPPKLGREPAERIIRAEGRRLDRFAAELDNAGFQIMFSLWRHASRSRDGWARASVPYSRLVTLPGLDRGSRLSRATIAARIRALTAAGHLRIASAPTPPKRGHRGMTTTYEVATLLMHRPGARAAPDDLVRIPAAGWEAMLALHGRLLRLLVRLRVRFGDCRFAISTREAGELIGVDRKAGAAALADLVELGWLRIETPPDAARKRRGVYLSTTPHPPPTPGY